MEDSGQNMEVELYSTIEYTPGWYYMKFPGFWNVECYKILSDYSMHPEKYAVPEEGVEETKDCLPEIEPVVDIEQKEHDHEHKKRKVDEK